MLAAQDSYPQPGFDATSPDSSPSSSTTQNCCVISRPCCGAAKLEPPRKIWLCCCCYCPHSTTTVLTTFGVFVLVITYTLLGALLFMLLEGGGAGGGGGNNVKHLAPRQKSNDEIRAETVEKLWSITEDLNILYKENWTRLAADEVLKFQDKLVEKLNGYNGGVALKGNFGGTTYYSHHQHHWSFASSYLYCLTLITTIGYGSVAPKTTWGKMATVLYAIIGIPLMLIYLSTAGEILSRNFRIFISKLFCIKTQKRNEKKSKISKKRRRNELDTSFSNHKTINNVSGSKIAFRGCDDLCIEKKEKSSNHPVCDYEPPGTGIILLSFLVVILYISGSAYLFHYAENWSYLEGSLFCFTSLSTIGFGDMMPGLRHNINIGNKKATQGEAFSVLMTSCFIMVGMGLIAMSFNLIQDHILLILKKLTKFFGVDSEMSEEKEELEGISMSIVSSTAS